MVSKATAGAGTQLYIGEALDNGVTLPAGDDFVQVGEVLTLNWSGMQKNPIDVTPLESLVSQSISGRPSSGTLELTMNMIKDDEGQLMLRDDSQVTDRIRNYRIVGPGDSPQLEANFTAEVMTYSLAFEGGAQVQANVSCQVSGAIEFTP